MPFCGDVGANNANEITPRNPESEDFLVLETPSEVVTRAYEVLETGAVQHGKVVRWLLASSQQNDACDGIAHVYRDPAKLVEATSCCSFVWLV